MRLIRRGSIVAALLVLLVVGAVAPAAGAPTTKAHRDPSGLWVLGAEPRDPVPDSLADAYGTAARLSEENPADFGFPVVRAGRVVLPTTSARSAALSATTAKGRSAALRAFDRKARTATTAARASGIAADKRIALTPAESAGLSARVDLPRGGVSRAAVEAIKDAAFDLAIAPRFDSADAWQTEIDPTSGVVVIRTSRLTAELAAAVVDTFGTELVAIRVEERPQTQPDARGNDTSPFYGGAAINIPGGGCTDAFSWYSGSTNMMLTAGHCLNNGGSTSTPAQSMGSTARSSRENWNNGTGTVYLSGQSTYRGDIALITLASGRSSSGRIYRGGATSSSSSAVGEMWSRRAQSGDQYCTGGSRSGEICGWTVSGAGVNHQYSNGEVVRNAVTSRNRQGWCTRPGDSGGPIYTVRSDGKVAAKGIHSGGGGGGSDYYGGLFDQCFEVFTDIYDPYYAFPGVLRTS